MEPLHISLVFNLLDLLEARRADDMVFESLLQSRIHTHDAIDTPLGSLHRLCELEIGAFATVAGDESVVDLNGGYIFLGFL